MDLQALKFIAAGSLVVAIGCSSSVDLDIEPAASAPPATTSEQPATEPTPEPPAERVAAEKPVNQSPGTGYLGGVAAGYRSARERIEDLPTKQAIRLFRGSEGRYPESHEEFMEKVVRANQMQLPAIEEGYKYQYDPEDQQLYKVPVDGVTDPVAE